MYMSRRAAARTAAAYPGYACGAGWTWRSPYNGKVVTPWLPAFTRLRGL